MEVCTLVPSPQPPALAVEQVRWYSYRAAWDPTDVSKLPEIPHRGSLLRFAAADSAALELSFRCAPLALRTAAFLAAAHVPLHI